MQVNRVIHTSSKTTQTDSISRPGRASVFSMLSTFVNEQNAILDTLSQSIAQQKEALAQFARAIIVALPR